MWKLLQAMFRNVNSLKFYFKLKNNFFNIPTFIKLTCNEPLQTDVH